MSISILYVRVSTLDQRTDRQRVSEKDFDKIIEDKCSGSIPMFDRPGGMELLSLIEKASTLLRNNISKDKISSMLGHSNSMVTEHYLASIDLEKTFDINSVLPKICLPDKDNESIILPDSKTPKIGLQFLRSFSSN
ncbi:MAG: recombinase family protein [Bacteroidales bacterium]|nr:recombinase family protein [Bacteroidales bacterium]